MTETVLLGSSTLPATLELAPGVNIQLGELVRYAQDASGLTAEKWNALKDGARDEWLATALEDLKDAAADNKLPESVKVLDAEAPKPTGKAKRGEEITEKHHMHPAYAGAMTGDQALQRHAGGLVDARIKAHKPTGK